jgi:hypothetical protein
MFLQNKEKRRKVLLGSLAAALFFVILLYFLRGPLAMFFIQKKLDSFNRHWHATLAIQKFRMTGLSSVVATGISLVPDNSDTLLTIDSVYASASLWKLLSGRLVINDVVQKSTHVTFIRRGTFSNYMFLLQRHGEGASPDTNSDSDYRIRISGLLNAVFDKIPDDMRIDDLRVSDDYNGHSVAFTVDSFSINDHAFRSKIFVTEDSVRSEWIAEGVIENHTHSARVKLFSNHGGRVVIPYIKFRLNTEAGFDTLFFTLRERNISEDQVVLSGDAMVRGLFINQERIAVNTVVFDRLAMEYRFNIGKDYVELDSSTRVTFNKLVFNPYVRYRAKPTRQITLSLHKPSFPGQDLFSSFPEGLFTTLDGIRTKGDLSFDLDFFVDLSIPDSLRLNVLLAKHGFSVISYGNADLAKLNTSFPYTAYEYGVPVRTFIVGPENPGFRTLDHISPYLQVSVLNSEDGGFFQHRGFMPDSFREALIQDIREQRFARGGSTISMQLVKNVFLSRNKTIGRKVEEMLLVWLLENQGVSSKERMYEVYLNIIEWGPGIYGANEGARFYFNKDASRLTLSESIFMASIIPRPKWFRYSFGPDGHLSESQAGFYRLLSEKMLAKGQITQRDFDDLKPDVDLKGPARLLLRKGEIPGDTIKKGEIDD